MAPEPLLIFGASARAAAFSALRANLVPWCADLFRDRDLEACGAGVRLPASAYPDAFLQWAAQPAPGPWMYTGALENRPGLVGQLARVRRLWGNDRPALARARSPEFVARLLAAAKVPCPAVHEPGERPLHPGTWLVKPRRGAGGTGIRFATDERPGSFPPGSAYLQEYIDGVACAAIYTADRQAVRLLGLTQQLTGADWLHARPFHYCGSIGPIELDAQRRAAFERLGTILARGCRLRGLFGIDCMVRKGVPWPVEVNPRYTASIEVLEYATGVPALALHRKAFEPAAPEPAPLPGTGAREYVGKAILFAREPLLFPGDGPWVASLPTGHSPQELPAFADIPHAGQRIRAGRPILSFFARAASPDACLDGLRQTAADLDHWLFSR